MPPFERGVYEPGEEVRVFDGSEDDEDVEGSRLPLLIVLALLVLAMFAGVVWLAYTQGVARGRTETPVVTAANGPARIAPTNPGGAEQPYKGFKIYEQPAPPDDDVPATAGPAASAQAPAAAPAKVPVAASEAKPQPQNISPPPATKPAITASAAAPTVTAPAPKPAAAKPAPVAKPAALLAIGPATAPPRTLAAPPKPAPVAATPAPKTSVASGSAVLQIGAYKSQADADAAWKTYRGKHAALLAGYSPDVQQADLGDKGTWYRLRIAGIASKDVASALCDRLKADGGTCFLGK